VQVEWRERARTDAVEIADYIEIDNPAAAIEVLREVHRKIAMLAEHPRMGRRGRVTGTRELAIVGTPYVVAYRVKDDVVSILRIWHGARRWPKSLR